MRHIFILELKKAVRNRKNWFVLILYTMLLMIFALSNMNTFQQVREQELQRIDYLMLLNRNTVRQIDAALVMDWGPWQLIRAERDEFDLSTYSILRAHAASAQRFATNLSILFEAIEEYDREAELLAYHRLLYDMSQDLIASYEWRGWPVWPDIYGPLSVTDLGIWIGGGGWLDFTEWDEFNRVKLGFVEDIVENNIHYLYPHEMTGFNFVYQVLLRFLPFIILLITFLITCDIFTRENETGSYKTLLLQPYPRAQIYLSKLISALGVAFFQIFLPLALLFLIFGVINGFGSANYPVLIHTNSYTTLTPLENNMFWGERAGFSFYSSAYFGSLRTFTNHGFAYVIENASIGISPYSLIPDPELFDPDHPFYGMPDVFFLSRAYASAYVPDPALHFGGMMRVILLTLPLYMVLLLLVISVSSLLGVITQHSTLSLVLGALLGMVALLFSPPIRNTSLLQRLNPYLYTNPLRIITGLGSTTGLMGILVLLGFSICFTVIGIVVFSRRDIRC